MKITTPTKRSTGLRADFTTIRERGARAGRRASPAIDVARRGADAMLRRWPAAVSTSRAGAGNVSRAIQSLPRSTVRTLTAGSLGFGAGLYLGNAPRIVAAIGVAPAIVMGASTLGRRDRIRDVRANVPESASGPDTELSRLDDDGSPVAAGTSRADSEARADVT